MDLSDVSITVTFSPKEGLLDPVYWIVGNNENDEHIDAIYNDMDGVPTKGKWVTPADISEVITLDSINDYLLANTRLSAEDRDTFVGAISIAHWES